MLSNEGAHLRLNEHSKQLSIVYDPIMISSKATEQPTAKTDLKRKSFELSTSDIHSYPSCICVCLDRIEINVYWRVGNGNGKRFWRETAWRTWTDVLLGKFNCRNTRPAEVYYSLELPFDCHCSSWEYVDPSRSSQGVFTSSALPNSC